MLDDARVTEPLNVIRVAAVIKAKNEESQIAAAIESARLLANEVVVVVDVSQDRTAAIAAAAGASVLEYASSYGRIDELDKVGIAAASGDWILRLDADERLTPALAEVLRSVALGHEYDGVAYARRNYMFGDWPRGGGWFVAHQLGFFRKSSYDATWSAELHSQVKVDGRIKHLPADAAMSTIHYDYDTVEEFIGRTLRRYAAVEAAQLHDRGVKFSRTRMILGPPARFWGRWIIRRGMRDGDRGLVLAALLAAYDICIQAILWDLQRRSERTGSETTDNPETSNDGSGRSATMSPD